MEHNLTEEQLRALDERQIDMRIAVTSKMLETRAAYLAAAVAKATWGKGGGG